MSSGGVQVQQQLRQQTSPTTPTKKITQNYQKIYPQSRQLQPQIRKMCNNNNALHLAMIDQDPKDLQIAKIIIDELREKCRYQTEHIMKWKKAYAIQIQQHYRYQKEKTEQMNSLTSQLLLLESRLKRKQKQIANIICHRELTILRQQKIIDTLSSRLVDHGLDTLDPSYTDFDSLNDSDSAVVLEDIDSDCNSSFSVRRRSSGGGGGDGVTIVRSISDAIETNLNKYGGARRTNCFLRRPDILETVYSVEEDPEPQQSADVAEKRDKFKNRSEKAVFVSSIEGHLDNNTSSSTTTTGMASTTATTSMSTITTIKEAKEKHDQQQQNTYSITYHRSLSTNDKPIMAIHPPEKTLTQYQHQLHQLHQSHQSSSNLVENNVKQSQVTNFNRVMSNHRSVTKPKDVKYKRINKAKSKSLEELRGRLRHWVERGSIIDNTGISGIAENPMPQTAQSYA